MEYFFHTGEDRYLLWISGYFLFTPELLVGLIGSKND